MEKCSNHIVIVHRDDAVLTFGGLMLTAIKKGETVNVNLIYGRDGSLIPIFKKTLLDGDASVMNYLERLSEFSDNREALEKIKYISSREGLSEGDELELGILVRTIEERACMKDVGANLIEHDFTCGYPLRGYKTWFDNDLNDLDEQSTIITRAVIQPLIESLSKSNNCAKMFFPSGIGGHPDHKILARCGDVATLIPNIKVFWGQDLPYATVSEFFAVSEVPLHQMRSKFIDISSVLNDKLRLLSSYYQSQLTNEDLRVVGEYHKALAKLIHSEYFSAYFKKNEYKTSRIKSCRIPIL